MSPGVSTPKGTPVIQPCLSILSSSIEVRCCTCSSYWGGVLLCPGRTPNCPYPHDKGNDSDQSRGPDWSGERHLFLHGEPRHLYTPSTLNGPAQCLEHHDTRQPCRSCSLVALFAG